MKAVIANDHGGVELAALIKEHLEKSCIEVTYLGTESTDSVDYPDMAEAAVNEYRKGGYDFGVLVCGTGIGISIAANKMKGIRCALIDSTFTASLAKEHNNANFVAFGGRVKYNESVLDILDAYIGAKFQNGRHQRRIDKIASLEGK